MTGEQAETVGQRFALAVAARPHAVALVEGQQSVSYAQLALRAERLACALEQAGVRSGDFVALTLERGINLIVAMLAIVRTGAAYVPIDPRYPASRRDYILGDCGASAAVVADGAGVAVRPLQPSRRPVLPAGAGRLLYVMYTSGSTGKPKGVMVTHANVLRLFASTRDEFGIAASDVWCGFHSPSFDLSGWEIWGALLHGGRHVVTPRDVARDPERFAALLHREQVTQLIQTPSAFRNLMPALLSAGCPASLRMIVFCGEKLDFQALRPWAAQVGLRRPALVNMFGPTETTIVATHHLVTERDLDGDGPNPIGAPIGDLRMRIVLPDGSDAPLDTPGMIHVGGPGVAAGYLGAQALTAAHFYTAPDGDGTLLRWYDTGDVGMRIAPNAFAYVSRADRQLKIRGYRIEPGEIEQALRACAEVVDCIATAADFPDHERRLVACVIATEAGLRDPLAMEQRLRAALAAQLPDYMLPSHFYLVRQFPMNENGKLDIAACVRAPQAARTPGPDGDAALHGLLRNIWSHILGCGRIGDDDNFFALGGTSITLVKMLGAVHALYGVKLILDVYETPVTINVVAQAIREQRGPDQVTR
ncbi:non-ribosomal peptide synthetase [Duganella sp. FT3S]|uniref:Non-ribosomal peptide synthetase n=1 Tax=Rugamonas fusca TaxID=2758568 RepID=A0A7W2EIK7_9BURK|nr:non-ribosomal peptide synthetase [Rugamonas fusca]MBA5606568.1 non-ribosomal peptide synthetase [Rugamonas fusca]